MKGTANGNGGTELSGQSVTGEAGRSPSSPGRVTGKLITEGTRLSKPNKHD